MIVALASLAGTIACASAAPARSGPSGLSGSSGLTGPSGVVSSPLVSPAELPPGAALAPLLEDLDDEGPVPGWEEASRRSFTAPAAGFARTLRRTLGRPVREPTTSPDGRHVAFVVSRSGKRAGGVLWIARAYGSDPYTVHSGLVRTRRPEWRVAGTPEGRIYFHSRGRVWSFRPVLLDE